mmetsp:Transcript_15992/g.34806  ORF Transcript_15992/g.34806 Transcript_15992/m.34806 type:complete len:1185 (-) Transcript_15992:250-3804(-)
MATYEEIIHEGCPEGGAPALKGRLVRFRKWATKKAGITVHSAVCVVNGEATDGQRNAPVLIFEPRPDPRMGAAGSGGGGANSSGGAGPTEARCGAVDYPADRAMYDRSIGCQVRTVRDLKKDEVALSIPASAMITPDLIAASDAGQALFACCHQSDDADFWDSFGVTGKLEKIQAGKIQQSNGTQLLVKILTQRKQVETSLARAERVAIEVEERGDDADDPSSKLAPSGSISRRAPYLAFLIHQRFAGERDPPVVLDEEGEGPAIPEGAPATFAPYVRSLPSSACLPICWKRNELALLAGCIPGMPALQKIAARTMQLATELVALVEGGLLWRFPSVFPPGTITWDRWVWAAAAYESRVLPALSLPSWICSASDSPLDVWESTGVMIPFLDMLNHEDETAQAQWRTSDDGGEEEDEDEERRLDVVTDERTKKHMQIYRNYGTLDNEHFMLQFGFTRMSNPADRVRIAWALVDGVGGVAAPADYEPVSEVGDIPSSHLVFESTDVDSVKAWWTEQRIALLGKATLNNDDTLDSLRKGKKITFCAFNNGKIDPMLIAVAVVATLPHEKVSEMFQKSANSSSSKPLDGLTLDKICQNSVRLYLSFLFAKKLGKLLQSLNSCLKDHFNSVQLWTKASSGGLNYVAGEDENAMSVDGSTENSGTLMGWQSFFDTYAWYSTMEVEHRYYSMAPDSCVLTLYDGHVRSLQNSLDVMATDDVFSEKVKQQLEELGCALDNTAIVIAQVQPVVTPTPIAATAVPEKEPEERVAIKSAAESKSQKPSLPKKAEQGTSQGNGPGNGQGNGNKTRVHNTNMRNKGERPPAIKLHIGNLSYKTMPNQLYDFFTKLYGEDSVLECHIPTERDTGNSRGFGFVTMPEQHARAALESGRKHEMDGRILKVAESNSAGSNRGRGLVKGGHPAPPAPSGDRCARCGYRPRWCTCNGPNAMPVMGMAMALPPQDNIYGPGPYLPPPPPPPMGGPGYGRLPHDADDRRMGDGYGRGGGGSGGGWGGSRRSRSRSPSYRRDHRDSRGYRGRSRSYSRSRSRSHSRGRDRSDRYRGSRHHDDRRGRYEDDRRSRGSSRRYRSKSRSRSRHSDGGASPRRGLVDESGNFSDVPKGGRSMSRSRSPVDGNGMDRPSSKKRDGKDSSGRGGRSRSRDRGRHRRKRSKGSRRDKGSSSKRRSRSRSRDRH